MQIYHMSGAGNDFMVIDARGRTLDFSTLARELCSRTGADGFMALDIARDADFTLHFYNSDGSRGEMCGNGARCICKFAYDLGVAGETMTVHTDAGPVYGWRLAENRYRVQLNNPSILDLRRTEDAAYVELGDPGIPHAIVELPGLRFEDAEALRQRATALRHNPAFPKGANISFYALLAPGQARVLTYERGVEDYTLACGTGCGCLAAVLSARGQLPGGKLLCQNRGGNLHITANGTSLFLEGPAEYLNAFHL